MSAVKDCRPIEDQVWQDCQKEGHEEGCYVMICPDCGDTLADCEEEKA
jgi:hypothetical protein